MCYGRRSSRTTPFKSAIAASGPTISEQLPPAPNRNMQFKQDMMTGILDLQKPASKPAAKPASKPVAKPTPKPVSKPTPAPVVKTKPTSAAAPAPTPKPAPAPTPKATAKPVVKEPVVTPKAEQPKPTPKKKPRRYVKKGGMISGRRSTNSLQIPTGSTTNLRY